MSLHTYLKAVRITLIDALTVSDIPSPTAERRKVPEVEVRESPELSLLKPLTVCRDECERVLVEPSINSVRVNIKVKHSDETEGILKSKFNRFLAQRPEKFYIFQRKPIKDYDISFLITGLRLQDSLKRSLVDCIIRFMEELDEEISELKRFLDARARFVAGSSVLSTLYLGSREVSPVPESE